MPSLPLCRPGPACAIALLAALLTACEPPEDPRAGMDPVELGALLFTQETFDGNGRVCATCHILENFGTMSPEHIQARWEADPGDPLFRSIDSDDGVGDDYTRLREHATVRVPITLGVHPESGLSVRRCDAPADTIVWLNRGNPSVFNIAREQHLMVDGRDGNSLPTQARNAVHTHAQPGREPTPAELEALAAFQRTLFSNDAVRRFVEHGEELTLPEPRTEQEARGREFFEPNRQCGVCHAGPLLNETSIGHPDGPGQLFETAVVGTNPDNPNPKHFWCWVDPATNQIALGPNGNTLVNYMPTSDPGIGLLMAEFPILNDEQELEMTPGVEVMMGIQSFFKTPTLWGSPQTAPYFHDNSAKDLAEVMDHYNFAFSTLPEGLFDIGCEYRDPECLSPQDKEDIIAFMQLLSFDTVEEQLAAVERAGGGGAGSH